jgi:2,4-dienoyl-CoA reductase-like NADH-dependent reductase (Old Yellow Enzyme family)
VSILFSPFNLNGLELKNRFVFSACEDNLATDRGEVTDKIISKMRRLAKGDVGLIRAGQAALMMRPVMGRMPIFAVGGWRHVQAMEDAVIRGQTDLISLCRPFIREPNLVRKIREGKADQAACINCNRCFIALAYDLPVRCYCKGLPV